MNDLDSYIVAPIYDRVVRRCGTQWHFVKGESFYNPLNLPSMSLDDLFTSFGISMREAASQLHKINGGEEGFYLVDILHKHYYYCGVLPNSVKDKLIELGIGRREQITGH
ncbi:hypothetical protein F7734_39815 [Scytonema sp. UIC 10036]|uniref:hypothetical protein n=1 Tax=Scytonema sp. UIC 10036 TaxID=2304196 RepID=UPI0012DADBB5|nr:hypothetical protein [Scytonema sp. UIC 10036]MUG98131.1 hypothetical protein [Scytonema sp. UIC 10036]